MTGKAENARSLATGLKRLPALPQEVLDLTEQVAALRGDMAELRRDVEDLGRRLPQQVPVPNPALGPDATPTAPAGDDGGLQVEPFDDGVELFAERMAVLEDGLDDVAARLEGLARDGTSLIAAKLEQLSSRVDELAARPVLTPEQLDEALARILPRRRQST
jgi:outer membrane murein-binding lipoprotein Lpp